MLLQAASSCLLPDGFVVLPWNECRNQELRFRKFSAICAHFYTLVFMFLKSIFSDIKIYVLFVWETHTQEKRERWFSQFSPKSLINWGSGNADVRDPQKSIRVLHGRQWQCFKSLSHQWLPRWVSLIRKSHQKQSWGFNAGSAAWCVGVPGKFLTAGKKVPIPEFKKHYQFELFRKRDRQYCISNQWSSTSGSQNNDEPSINSWSPVSVYCHDRHWL